MQAQAPTEPTAPTERLLYEVKKVIVGQDHLLERLIVALLARGHVLVEGVPGLAKTMAIKTLAEACVGNKGAKAVLHRWAHSPTLRHNESCAQLEFQSTV